MGDNVLVGAILPVLNNILGVRQKVAYLGNLYRVTRTYDSDRINYTETEVEILPIPGISDRKRDVSFFKQGEIAVGDLFVTCISKSTYTHISQLETSEDPASLVLTLYKFVPFGRPQDGEYYLVSNIREKLVTWDMDLVRYTGG